MKSKLLGFVAVALSAGAPLASASGADGDPKAGARAFRACAACHSLVAGRHLSGPSLARIWGRKAGTIAGFKRYSPALTKSDVVWTEDTLDAWLADPKAMIPGNRMTFAGIRNARARADLIAYLKETTSAANAPKGGRQTGDVRETEFPDLKAVAPNRRVTGIRYCDDTYHVTTASGETLPFWEFNLRFKTDSSAKGPAGGKPALLRASMMGDRAFVIFGDPREISPFIEVGC